MSANPQHHHDTAAEDAGGPTATISAVPGGQNTAQVTGSPYDDRTDSAAIAAATTSTAHPSHIYDENAAGDAETLSYPPLDPSQPLLPPANFSPFFTLVEDATTAEHHHPSVHYVFSDDDPDLHTAVFMRALGDTAAVASSPTATKHDGGADLLPPPVPGVRERYVVVDLTPDGQAVAGATSLSRDWQVIGTAIAPAPSFAEDNAADAGGGGGGGGGVGGGALMLRVEGTEAAGGRPSLVGAGRDDGEDAKLALGDARRAADGDLVGGLEELLQRFDSGVEMLRKVVGPDLEILMQDAASADDIPPSAAADGAAA